MTEITPTQHFALVLQTAGMVFNREVTTRLVEIYLAALRDLSISACTQALESLIGRSEFMPKPVEIRQEVEGGGREQRALDAWAVTINLCHNWRAARHPDPVGEQAVRDIGGWQRLGMADRDTLAFLRREFLAAYGAAETRPHRLRLGTHNPNVADTIKQLADIKRVSTTEPRRIAT